MSDSIPFEDRPKALEELERHGRCLAIELRSLGIAYDTIVVNGHDKDVFEGWEIPAGEVPTDRPLMLGPTGIFVSRGERIIGREVYPISNPEVARYGAARAISQRLMALETKHDVFEKIRKGAQNPSQPE